MHASLRLLALITLGGLLAACADESKASWSCYRMRQGARCIVERPLTRQPSIATAIATACR